jgi:hypothetical protein
MHLEFAKNFLNIVCEVTFELADIWMYRWINWSFASSVRNYSAKYFSYLHTDNLPDDEVIELFDELSSVSSDKYIQFTSTIISWTLNKENTANRKYSPQMIKTVVDYFRECGGDQVLQKLYGTFLLFTKTRRHTKLFRVLVLVTILWTLFNSIQTIWLV